MGCILSSQKATAATNPPNRLLIRLIDVLSFFDRPDLESVSLSSRFVRQIVLRHFTSKPYFVFNGHLFIARQWMIIIKLSGEIQYFSLHAANWIDLNHIQNNELIDLSQMRPYLHSWLRFKKVSIKFPDWRGYFLYILEWICNDYLTYYKSVRTLWTGQQLRLHIYENTTPSKNTVCIMESLLKDLDFLRCNELQYNAWNYVPNLHSFPLIYKINVIRFNVSDELNVENAVNLIEGKALYSDSQTTFVMEWENGENVVSKITELIVGLCIKFVSSSTPCQYLVVFLCCVIDYEFSLENQNTQEKLISRDGGGEDYFHVGENPGSTFTLQRFSNHL
ncbi:hypothetical protein DdX_08803 [Ditylenchus destructor]|uniref:Uncharacterized protein n=1 Tax=Ditylenchus destructor TaxID=166010 RepID=A0AAD4N5T6_9BILA|nr:hypothetical protein DdX_08803 [Ditylenchus destructor]